MGPVVSGNPDHVCWDDGMMESRISNDKFNNVLYSYLSAYGGRHSEAFTFDITIVMLDVSYYALLLNINCILLYFDSGYLILIWQPHTLDSNIKRSFVTLQN